MQPAGPPAPIPVPYPNLASAPLAPAGANTQLLNMPALQMSSAMPSTAGDEAGTMSPGADIMRRLTLATDPSQGPLTFLQPLPSVRDKSED
jgi:hypothetical protein